MICGLCRCCGHAGAPSSRQAGYRASWSCRRGTSGRPRGNSPSYYRGYSRRNRGDRIRRHGLDRRCSVGPAPAHTTRLRLHSVRRNGCAQRALWAWRIRSGSLQTSRKRTNPIAEFGSCISTSAVSQHSASGLVEALFVVIEVPITVFIVGAAHRVTPPSSPACRRASSRETGSQPIDQSVWQISGMPLSPPRLLRDRRAYRRCPSHAFSVRSRFRHRRR
jgi:hypothetical protein